MIIIQERDLRILTEIAMGPACTRDHIATWLFDRRSEAAKKRIQLLISAGLIERTAPLAPKRILRITELGFEMLRENGMEIEIKRAPKAPKFFDHEISFTACRLSLTAGLSKRADVHMFSFSHEQKHISIFCPMHFRIETVRADGMCAVSTVGFCTSAN